MSNPHLNKDSESLSALEKEFENNIRPSEMADFSGQPQTIENLRIFIKAAKIRGEALDHILFHGPPGLGKTTFINKALTEKLCDTDAIESTIPYKQLVADDALPICRTYSAGKASW